MEDKGSVSSFLGLNIIRTPDYIAINQTGYIDRMLERFQMINCKTAKTPLNPSLPLRKATPTDKRMDQNSYQELTGSLNHAAVFSRPDIAYAASKLSQFNSDPTEIHMKTARHVLRYLKGTRDYCIVYGNSQNVEIPPMNDDEDNGLHGVFIIGYADADHGGIKMIGSLLRDIFLLLIMIRCPGHLTSNHPMRYLQWNQNIWQFRMHLEKQLQEHNSTRISIYFHPLLRSF